MASQGPEGGLTEAAATEVTFDQFAYALVAYSGTGSVAYWKFTPSTREAVTIDSLLSTADGAAPPGWSVTASMSVYYKDGSSNVSVGSGNPRKFITEPGRTYYISVDPTLSGGSGSPGTPNLYAVIRVSAPGPFATADWVQEEDRVFLYARAAWGINEELYGGVYTYHHGEDNYHLPPGTDEWGPIKIATDSGENFSVGSLRQGGSWDTNPQATNGPPSRVPALHAEAWESLWKKVRKGNVPDADYLVSDPPTTVTDNGGAREIGYSSAGLSYHAEDFQYFSFLFGDLDMSVSGLHNSISLHEVMEMTAKTARNSRYAVQYGYITDEAQVATGLTAAEIVWEKDYPDIIQAAIGIMVEKGSSFGASGGLVSLAASSAADFMEFRVAYGHERVGDGSGWGPWFDADPGEYGYNWKFAEGGSDPESSLYYTAESHFMGRAGIEPPLSGWVTLPHEDILAFEEATPHPWGNQWVAGLAFNSFPKVIFSDTVPFPYPIASGSVSGSMGGGGSNAVLRCLMRPVRYRVRMYLEPEEMEVAFGGWKVNMI